MRHQDRWFGKHNGVPYEIVNWGQNKEFWNYYLYFSSGNTTPSKFAELLTIQHAKYSIGYSDSWLAALDWHYGCTFGEFQFNSMGEKDGVKAGCDYSHYWDEGNTYHLEDVRRDCLQTIESASSYLLSEGDAA